MANGSDRRPADPFAAELKRLSIRDPARYPAHLLGLRSGGEHLELFTLFDPGLEDGRPLATTHYWRLNPALSIPSLWQNPNSGEGFSDYQLKLYKRLIRKISRKLSRETVRRGGQYKAQNDIAYAIFQCAWQRAIDDPSLLASSPNSSKSLKGKIRAFAWSVVWEHPEIAEFLRGNNPLERQKVKKRIQDAHRNRITREKKKNVIESGSTSVA